MCRDRNISRPYGEGVTELSRKRTGLAKLRIELLAAALVSLIFAFSVQKTSYYVGVSWVDKQLSSAAYLGKHALEMISSLQHYIDENELSDEDTSRICSWQKRENVSFSLYDETTHEMTYFYIFSDEQPLTVKVEESEYALSKKNANANGVLVFADGSRKHVMMMFDRIYSYYNVAYVVSLGLGGLCYLVLLLLLINRKIKYIKKLTDELKILEGGDLEYEITVKGRDEIAELAQGLNSMRKAVLYRENEERKNVRLNRDLVTALSHDIRTPMTSLIGYLEILKMHRFQTEEQKMKYLESAHQKAFQLKEMTDTLFEYSLVSGKTQENYNIEMISAADVLTSIEDTQIADLLSDGWKIRKEFSEEGRDVYLDVDMDFYCRVLDNLVSNIRKYADKSEELLFSFRIKDNCFCLGVKNKVLQGETLEGSTGVGLKTCEKIMRDMNGILKVEREEDTFCVTLIQPCLRNV